MTNAGQTIVAGREGAITMTGSDMSPPLLAFGDGVSWTIPMLEKTNILR